MKYLTILLILTQWNCFLNPFASKEKDNTDLLLGLAFLSLQPSGYQWDLPPGFPIPRVPEDNPMSQEKVDLGRLLFYDTKLSGNNTMSCASCHFQHLAFADDKIHPKGITGDFHPRNSQPLFNVAYNSRQTWNNILLVTLEQQASGPLFGENPVELGLAIQESQIREKLLSEPIYSNHFRKAFPQDSEPITVSNMIKAIASFQRTLISGNSPYDKATFQGERTAMSASARRGLNLFSSEVAECFHCHDGVNFNDSTFHANTSAVIEPLYHNNALYNIPGKGNPDNNKGLEEVTGNINHRGGFKSPSLRNLAFTFPYMHDGSIHCDDINNPHHPTGKSNGATMIGCAREALGRVIEHYKRGGNNSTCAAFSGETKDPSYPCVSTTPQATVDSTLIRPFSITNDEKNDLVEFLLSLTDESFVRDTRFSNPR